MVQLVVVHIPHNFLTPKNKHPFKTPIESTEQILLKGIKEEGGVMKEEENFTTSDAIRWTKRPNGVQVFVMGGIQTRAPRRSC